MFLSFLLSRSISQQIEKQLDILMTAKWEKTKLIAESLCFFGEFKKDQYQCAINQINALEKFPNSIEQNIQCFKPCLSESDQKFLQYNLQYHVFSPRIAFYSTIKDNYTTSTFDFEPNFKNIKYFDFNSPVKLPENTVIRPITKLNADKNPQILNGYGVELRPFKYSMEYGVKDPSQLQKGSLSILNDESYEYIKKFEESDEVNFDNLVYKHLESYIMNSDDPLRELKEVVENWPIAMKKIYQSKIDGNSHDEEYSESVMTLNGRIIPFETFDPFTFSSQIFEIITTQKILTEKFGLTPKKANILMETETRKSNLVIDVRGDHIIWLNNLETDKRYSKYSRKIDSLFGKLTEPPKVRHNLVNMVLFIDPSSTKDMKLLLEVHKLLEKGYAMRVGISPLHRNNNENQIKALYDIFRDYNPFKYVSLLVKGDSIKSAYEKMTKKEYSEDFSEESEEYISLIDSFCEESNINETAIWTNGDLYTGNDLEEKISISPLETLQILRNLLMENEVTGDYLSFILRKRHAVKRLIPEISKIKPISTKISQEKIEKIEEFIQFSKSVKYQKRDEEKSLVTCWLKIYKNKEIIEEKIDEFFKSRHQSSVRLSFVSEFPSLIEQEILNKNNDAVLFLNGRIFYINSSFEYFDDLFSWQSLTSSQLSETIEDEDLMLFWSSYLLSLNEREIEIKHFHPNEFNPDEKFALNIDGELKTLDVKCVIDPFTKNGQKIISFLCHFSDLSFCRISLHICPSKRDLTIPKSFYRFVTDERALLSSFNNSMIYSILLETPETWMVEQKKVDCDVDNVLGSDLQNGYRYQFEYVLSYLVVEGYSYDLQNNPSENVQIKSFESDTTVMSNNGYFQLKTTFPTILDISLFSDFSKENFEIMSGNKIIFDSFNWRHFLVRIQRKSSKIQKFPYVDDGKIHMFGVCSGRLYERLMKIMILSVKQNSQNSTTKFWLLKNYLSPKFRSELQIMSSEIGFEYEFVSYHWPHFITRQEEKQRVIWGNKILFLDVLFPASLHKVIYIDADQVVRTNMRELMRMDLHNNPYGFTPMCDSRKETEPFRFWHQGYWKEHLQGRNYHISALFVTDLQRFREMKAGELLRDYYNSLVLDDQSLANLDQDLPNYAQEKIGIFSLSQDWLWCETWCSDETMDKAKTIDLCNNPLTKAPKLQIAKERIKEWPELDKLASTFEQKQEKNDEL